MVERSSAVRDDTAFARWETLDPPTPPHGFSLTTTITAQDVNRSRNRDANSHFNDGSKTSVASPTAAPGAGAGPAIPSAHDPATKIEGSPLLKRQNILITHDKHVAPSSATALEMHTAAATSTVPSDFSGHKNEAFIVARNPLSDADLLLERLADKAKQAAAAAAIQATALPTSAAPASHLTTGIAVKAGRGVRREEAATAGGTKPALGMGIEQNEGFSIPGFHLEIPGVGKPRPTAVDAISARDGQQHEGRHVMNHAAKSVIAREGRDKSAQSSSSGNVSACAARILDSRRDESVVAGGSGIERGGGARLGELCQEDKAKVARLMQDLMKLRGEKSGHDARLSRLRAQNECIVKEMASLKFKFGQSMQLLRKYQNIVKEGEAAGGGAVVGASSGVASDASVVAADICSLREALHAAEESAQSAEKEAAEERARRAQIDTELQGAKRDVEELRQQLNAYSKNKISEIKITGQCRREEHGTASTTTLTPASPWPGPSPSVGPVPTISQQILFPTAVQHNAARPDDQPHPAAAPPTIMPSTDTATHNFTSSRVENVGPSPSSTAGVDSCATFALGDTMAATSAAAADATERGTTQKRLNECDKQQDPKDDIGTLRERRRPGGSDVQALVEGDSTHGCAVEPKKEDQGENLVAQRTPAPPQAVVVASEALLALQKQVEILKQELVMVGVRQLAITGIPTRDAILLSTEGSSGEGGGGGVSSPSPRDASPPSPDGGPFYESTSEGTICSSRNNRINESDSSSRKSVSGNDEFPAETQRQNISILRRSGSVPGSGHGRTVEYANRVGNDNMFSGSRLNIIVGKRYEDETNLRADGRLAVDAQEESWQCVHRAGKHHQAVLEGSEHGGGWSVSSADDLLLASTGGIGVRDTAHNDNSTDLNVSGGRGTNGEGALHRLHDPHWAAASHDEQFQERAHLHSDGEREADGGWHIARHPRTWFETRDEQILEPVVLDEKAGDSYSAGIEATTADEALRQQHRGSEPQIPAGDDAGFMRRRSNADLSRRSGVRVSWSSSISAASSVPSVELASDGGDEEDDPASWHSHSAMQRMPGSARSTILSSTHPGRAASGQIRKCCTGRTIGSRTRGRPWKNDEQGGTDERGAHRQPPPPMPTVDFAERVARSQADQISRNRDVVRRSDECTAMQNPSRRREHLAYTIMRDAEGERCLRVEPEATAAGSTTRNSLLNNPGRGKREGERFGKNGEERQAVSRLRDGGIFDGSLLDMIDDLEEEGIPGESRQRDDGYGTARQQSARSHTLPAAFSAQPTYNREHLSLSSRLVLDDYESEALDGKGRVDVSNKGITG